MSNTEQKYQIIVSAEQLQALQHACEVVARLKIGQFHMALETCNEKQPVNWEVVKGVEAIMKPLMGLAPNACKSLSNCSSASLLWDLQQVFRHHLSWEQAQREGLLNPDGTRNWSTMMGVNYDDPLPMHSMQLATVKKL